MRCHNPTPRHVWRVELRHGGRAGRQLSRTRANGGDRLAIARSASAPVRDRRVVEVEGATAHYLLPPQQAAWIPVGLEHQATMTPDVRSVAVMFDPELLSALALKQASAHPGGVAADPENGMNHGTAKDGLIICA